MKGRFAPLYPEELSRHMPLDMAKELAYKLKFKAVAMFPAKDIRKSFTAYEGTISDISRALADHILQPPEYVEPSIDYMIKIPRDGATYLTKGLAHLSGFQLKDVFGGKHVFEDILQYEEREYPIENMRIASAYILINQLLFYHVLSKMMPNRFSEINTDYLNRPQDLKSYFKKVLNLNYQPIFSYDILVKIPIEFFDTVKTLINAIQGLSPEKIRRDLLGLIFHDLVPFEVRKPIAVFYTNMHITELLAHLAIDKYDAKVADLAVGRLYRYLGSRAKEYKGFIILRNVLKYYVNKPYLYSMSTCIFLL